MRRFEILRAAIVDTRGAEIAEAAAVLPLMFMILLGIFWFGQAFSIYGTITRAAQEGARAGAVPSCTTCGLAPIGYAANAATATQNALTVSNLDYKLAVWPTPAPTFTSCSSSGVTCTDGGNNYICVQVPVRLTTSAGGTGDCGISVSFQYPYTFWLPFTSLNKKQILLRASARVRMETQ